MTETRARGTLVRWSWAWCADRARLRRRAIPLALLGLGLAVTAALPPKPLLVWNASASAPIGLYLVTRAEGAEPGQMVIAWAPARYRRLAAERRYLPLNVPLVKRVAAIAGDEVCALGQEIFINGRWTAERRIGDARGRSLPQWTACLRLHGRQLFLLMDNPGSFDGRYFGVTEGVDVVGRARLIWRR